MTDVIGSAPNVAAPEKPESTDAPAADDNNMSDLEKIKAAQAARRTRRTRGPAETSSTSPTDSAPSIEKTSGDASGDTSAEVEKLRQEMATVRLEMSSLRRNHLNNLKKVTEERDMFATQLAREQASSEDRFSGADKRKLADVEVQLRAARTRNNDLENENGVLRDEVKQLNFRVQASKTMDAATNGYERIVDDLVNVKLKLAQLQEEKEDLLRINKELTQTSAMLTEANGELEKSRSQWVVQCAEVEKKKTELEKRVKEMEDKQANTAERKSDVKEDTSYDGSDLQDIKLN